MKKLEIIYKNHIDQQDNLLLNNGLFENASFRMNFDPIEHYSFMITNDKIIGGISGSMFYGCLTIDTLYIDQAHQKQGLGSKLIEKAEELAVLKSCLFITVNTMSFEAAPFYIKHGFYIEFERVGYNKGTKMIVLRKDL